MSATVHHNNQIARSMTRSPLKCGKRTIPRHKDDERNPRMDREQFRPASKHTTKTRCDWAISNFRPASGGNFTMSEFPQENPRVSLKSPTTEKLQTHSLVDESSRRIKATNGYSLESFFYLPEEEFS